MTLHRLLFALALAMVLTVAPYARAAGDPYLEWWTIRTEHATIHYYKGLEPIAERVADIVEGMHSRMAAELGWSPSQITEVVVTDESDAANGSATAFPYNTVRLFVTAPDDMSPLGDYDDWYLELITHEYTHILHTDNITGAPALVNSIVGRTFVPNQAQPRWILEGLAVINESRHSTAGRMRSSMFDMYLRGDVLEDRIFTLDQMSHSPRRWPQGNIWYLYGSRFLGWIGDTYGYDALAAVPHDTGAQLIPYGVNRAIRRSTGATYEQLYEAWVRHLREHYTRQLKPVFAKGLREGTRLTFHGEMTGRPRFVPPAGRVKPDAAMELVYYRADGHERMGLYRLAADASMKPVEPELVARTSGMATPAFAPDGALYFNMPMPWKRVYFFNDIMRLPPRTTARSGLEPELQRLTSGMRARDIDVSPDGRSITYTISHRGTSYLKVADITPEGGLANSRTLVPSARFEQAYTPRFSPDGSMIAYSAWSSGGYRDIRLVDVATGRYFELMHDRAMDMQPSFSPDGRFVLFTSDRTGIPNVYAYEYATRRLLQVTNVRLGAYQGELSPDGKTLVYVGYGSTGYDLWSLPFDPDSLLPAEPYRPAREDQPLVPIRKPYDKRPYNPLPTLRPRALSLQYGPGTFGQALTVETQGADVVGHHAFSASAAIESEETVPFASVAYLYNRLPFNFTSRVFRTLAPRKGFRINDQEPIWLERTLGWSNAITYTMPGPFDSQTFGFTYSIANVDGELPVGTDLDPYAQISRDPYRGYLGVTRMAWAYTKAERFLHSVGPERGFTLGVSADVADTFTASQYSLYAFGYQATAYVPMPWRRHHTLALHVGGAGATGDYPRRGLYHVGGFVDSTIQDVINNTIFQGGFVLRGYKPVSFIGSQYHLANAEYRFPILNADRGVSTLPVFLQRINGTVFLDYGGAFETFDVDNWRDQFHTGVGGELWFEMQLGYYTNLNVRIGYAQGYGEAAEPGGQKYVVVAAPF